MSAILKAVTQAATIGTQLIQTLKGEASYFDIDAGERGVANAAWRYQASPEGCPDLSGLVASHWRLMDAWYEEDEEDEEVLARARSIQTNRHRRIDVLRSTRRVRVSAGDTLHADSRNVRMLFETGMPVRYYIPREDVSFEYLVDSDIVSACAYKGITSRYWSQRDGPSTSPGATSSRSPRSAPSRGWSGSSTSASTSRSTACSRSARRHRSPEACAMTRP